MKKTEQWPTDAEAVSWAGYRLLFEINPQPMFIKDRDTQAFLAVNDAAVRAYGYTREDFLAMTQHDIWPKADRPQFLERLRAAPEGLFEVGASRHQKKDGTVFTVQVTRHTLDFNGRPAILAIARDTTDLHSVTQALREHEDLFRLMVDGSKDYGIFMLDAGGRVLTWNEGAQRNTGYTAEEIIGRHCSCFHTPEDVRQGRPDAGLIIAESKGRYEEENWQVRKDGSRFYADTVISPVRDSFGSLRGYACIRRDVTERKALEQRILDIAEREQKRIGQDLHDSLGQRLTGIGFLTQALEEKLASRKSPEIKEAAAIRTMIVETLEQTRRLARGLYSAHLEANRLIPALEQLLDDARTMFKISAELKQDGGTLSQEKNVSTQLYHIAQEAIHNAVRHGTAKRIWLELENTPASLILSIRDDGKGIPENLPKDGGMGLRIMDYRAGLIGGQISIQRHPEGGTIVTCRVDRGRKE